MKFREMFKSFLKRDNDYWLNIYNIYVNIRAGFILLAGFFYATINAIVGNSHLNFLGVSRGSFLGWIISILTTVLIVFVSTVISKVILSFLSDIKKIRDKSK